MEYRIAEVSYFFGEFVLLLNLQNFPTVAN